MYLLKDFEDNKIKDLVAKRGNFPIPSFKAGDTIKLTLKIASGKREQIYEGLCIAKRNRGLGSSFTLRKISVGSIGVERSFPLYSPAITSITVVGYGKVRQSKIYYMRELKGKKARIKVDIARAKENRAAKASKAAKVN